MGPMSAKTFEWQYIGGSLTIPDGWFVNKVDLDCHTPYAKIVNDETREEKTVLIPKPLAYYLGTHSCGSDVMRANIEDSTRRSIKNTIKDALGL